MTTKTITLAQLVEADACQEQVDLFQSTFGESVELTLELCVKHAYDFSFCWAGDNLLNRNKRAAFQAAKGPQYAAYRAAVALHEPAFQATMALRWAEYQVAAATEFFNLYEGEP